MKLLRKIFKFIGEAFMASHADTIRKKDLQRNSPTYRYQKEQFLECYEYFKKNFSFYDLRIYFGVVIYCFSIKLAFFNILIISSIDLNELGFSPDKSFILK